MATLVIPETLIFNEDSNTPVDPQKINALANLIKNTINSLDADNVANASLHSNKFQGGAILQENVSTAGAANKVVQLDSSGDMTLGGSIRFTRQ